MWTSIEHTRDKKNVRNGDFQNQHKRKNISSMMTKQTMKSEDRWKIPTDHIVSG